MKIPSLALLLLTLLSISINSSHCTEPETILQLVTSKPRTLTQLRFQSFIQKYNKRYHTPSEYAHRFTIFSKNLAQAAINQALDPTAKHGITKFSDLAEEEFQTQYLGLAVSDESNKIVNTEETAPEINPKGLPRSFDWRQKGAVTDVKTQGVCGSCWAFSTTGAIEGANFIATGKLLNLSEQQLVDCDHTVTHLAISIFSFNTIISCMHAITLSLLLQCDAAAKKECNNGCSGGLMTNAYNYLMKSGGLQEEKSYPYTGKQGECRFDEERVVVRVKNFTKVPFDEQQIAANLVVRGPLAIGLNAAFMQTYVGGVSCPLICPKMFINHGVLLVGYGARGFSILRLGYQPYWIVKNSWGKNWGEGGYYRLCKGRHMCGMNTMVSAVAVESY